ncbi:MAG: hypothetical protein Q8908_09540 [Bacteroidota bacterium]|nr:hypothetical protein [Bacteroidota bacterium]
MKTLFKKIGLLTLIPFMLITIFLYIGEMYYNTGEYPMWKSKIEFITHVHNTSNIVIGDSRAVAGIVPGIIGDNFNNLAIGGGSPIDGYLFLKRYLQYHRVNKIIISYSPSRLENYDVFFDRTLKFDLLSFSEMNEILSKSKEENDLFFESYNDCVNCDNKYADIWDYYKYYFKSLLIKIKFFYYYLPEIKNSIIEYRYTHNMNVYNNIKKRLGNYDFGTDRFSAGLCVETQNRKHYKVSKVLDFYLNKILSLAQENNIKVYCIAAPFNVASFKSLNSNYIKGYNAYIQSLRNKYKNIVYQNGIYSYGNERFGDPSHLNPFGAAEFSKHVRDDILNKY